MYSASYKHSKIHITISIFQQEKWGSAWLSDIMKLGYESMAVWLQGLYFPLWVSHLYLLNFLSFEQDYCFGLLSLIQYPGDTSRLS